MIQSDIDSINSWLASGRDYDQGITILVKHSRNPSMKRIFQGREHRYASKLSYEIGKLISEVKTSKPQVTKPVKHVKRYADFRGCFAARIFADFLKIRVDPRCEASASSAYQS